MQRVGRAAESVVTHHLDEITKLTDIHGRKPITVGNRNDDNKEFPLSNRLAKTGGILASTFFRRMESTNINKTVIQHVLSRLRDLGIKDVFGVAGDYAFPIEDAVCEDKEMRWI